MLHNNNNWCYTLHNFAWFWVNAKIRVKKWLVHCMITLKSDNCIALHSVGCIEVHRECSEIVGRLKRHQSLARGVPNVPTGPCLMGEGANFVLWGNSWTFGVSLKYWSSFFLSYLAVHSKIKILYDMTSPQNLLFVWHIHKKKYWRYDLVELRFSALLHSGSDRDEKLRYAYKI